MQTIEQRYAKVTGLNLDDFSIEDPQVDKLNAVGVLAKNPYPHQVGVISYVDAYYGKWRDEFTHEELAKAEQELENEMALNWLKERYAKQGCLPLSLFRLRYYYNIGDVKIYKAYGKIHDLETLPKRFSSIGEVEFFNGLWLDLFKLTDLEEFEKLCPNHNHYLHRP